MLLSRLPCSWTDWLRCLHYHLPKWQLLPGWAHLREGWPFTCEMTFRSVRTRRSHPHGRQVSGLCVQVRKFLELQKIVFALLSPQISRLVTETHPQGRGNSGLLASSAKPQFYPCRLPWRNQCVGCTNSPPTCQTVWASAVRTFLTAGRARCTASHGWGAAWSTC